MLSKLIGIRGGLALSVALAVAIAWLAFRGSDQVGEASVWIDHTHHVMEALSDVQARAIDAEFAAGGKERDVHDRTLVETARVRHSLDTLRAEVADNSEQARRAEELAAIVETRLAHAEHPETMPASGTPERRAIIGDGRTQTFAKIEEMHAAENRLLADREMQSTNARRQSQGFVVAGALTSVLLLVFAFTRMQRESEARARATHEMQRLLDATPDAIVIADPRGVIVRVNNQATVLFGYARDELVGAKVETLLPDRFRTTHVGHREGYAAAPATRPMGKNRTLFGLRKNGTEFSAAISLSPIETDDGVLAIAAVRDITAEVQAAEVLRQARDEAQAATRELESFSYSVAHDLRAPLRSISGFAQALREDCEAKLDDQGRDYLGRVTRSALRMGELIDDLLALSRVTRSDISRERIDVSKLARDITKRLAASNGTRTVHAKIADGITADADPRLVAVVLENLLSNAWKFTSKKEEAHIEVGVCGGTQGELFVKDDGAGFEMEHASRLFGAFQRLHRSSEFDGHGIGLATVQRVIHRHGGSIRAESAVGQGATFYFTLEGARS